MEKDFIFKYKSLLLDDFKIQNRKGLYGATQKLMAYNSNKIEGSTLTSEQTASLFDTGTLVSNGVEVYRSKDIEEMNGHFKMFNHMLKTIDEPLTIKMIKEFHYNLKSGVFEDYANGFPVGEFKNRQNQVSDISTSAPKDVEKKMALLLEEYNNSTKTLRDLAIFHSKYELIHPFQDGNGRTGRMILFKQCINNNIFPIIIKDDNKALYYNALHLAQTQNDYSRLVSFFENCQADYKKIIENYIIVLPKTKKKNKCI